MYTYFFFLTRYATANNPTIVKIVSNPGGEGVFTGTDGVIVGVAASDSVAATEDVSSALMSSEVVQSSYSDFVNRIE